MPHSIHLPQNHPRQTPGGPVRRYFAQHPPLSFSHPSFSLPVRPFQYSSTLPCSLPPSPPPLPNSGYSQSEARKAAALSSLDFSAAVSPLCCTVLFRSLWCHTHWGGGNPVSKILDWNLVNLVVAHLKWGWINSCCVSFTFFISRTVW